MVMITGTTPDSYRDYELDKEIPGLLDAFREQADALYAAAALFESLGGEEKSQSEDILGMARRLESLIRDPRSIQKRLSSYREGISALSSWLYDRTSQPLEMDYLIVHSAGQELPSPRASFWQQVSHFSKSFRLLPGGLQHGRRLRFGRGDHGLGQHRPGSDPGHQKSGGGPVHPSDRH